MKKLFLVFIVYLLVLAVVENRKKIDWEEVKWRFVLIGAETAFVFIVIEIIKWVS